MNRILHWLTVKLSRSTVAETAEQFDSDYEEHGFSEEDNPGEPVTIGDVQAKTDDLTPDIYREATGDTEPELEIIESPSPISDMSESFDTNLSKQPGQSVKIMYGTVQYNVVDAGIP